ncbi:hypothetical protein F4823DRAFT_563451 [Ustulina deusta]|nr:hypothetical protein F4823DRAFT_563451 [Ustulina deusta]
MASGTHVQDPELGTGSSIPKVAENTAAVLDALAHGLGESPWGFEKDMVAVAREEVTRLTHSGKHLDALELALIYACGCAFDVGYEKVFKICVGVHHGYKHKDLAIFLSFRVTTTSGVVIPGEDTGNTGGGAQAEPAPQHGQETVVTGMRRATKKWVAKRILSFALEIYGDATFPETIWFLEDWSTNGHHSLLLPYALGVTGYANLLGGSNTVCRRIIDQIIASGVDVEKSADDKTCHNLEEQYLSQLA